VIFVDSSGWFAAVNRRDRHHARATELLSTHSSLVTSDFVIVETWLLINSRMDFATAERFVAGVRASCRVESIVGADWVQASVIADQFADQTYSLVDRTSFAVMERLGLGQALSFDSDFLTYRYGSDRTKSFAILR
jgi:uncharacterized protein